MMNYKVPILLRFHHGVMTGAWGKTSRQIPHLIKASHDLGYQHSEGNQHRPISDPVGRHASSIRSRSIGSCATKKNDIRTHCYPVWREELHAIRQVTLTVRITAEHTISSDWV